MTIETLKISPIQDILRSIGPEEIFETSGSFVLNDLGIAVQALLVGHDALTYALRNGDASDDKRREAASALELRYQKVEEMRGIKIPRGEQAVDAFRSKFGELVKQRVNLLNKQ